MFLRRVIVNNFVSGLILLFERPIQIGDTVQLSDIIGEVKRIGIRSSTIRTPSGAEVILPNSSLISERVTNRTLSDRSRRFEIPVALADAFAAAGIEIPFPQREVRLVERGKGA